jgi:hypothetical protein
MRSPSTGNRGCGGPGQPNCGGRGNGDTAEERLRNEIERQFDPYTGAYSADFIYEGSDQWLYDKYSLYAYEMNGIDLMQIAMDDRNNPMTDTLWRAAEGVPIEYLFSKGNLQSHGPYYFFLVEAKKDLTYSNLEPNYLAAMMKTHPQQVNAAKEAYYRAVLQYNGDDPVAALEYLLITKELAGMDVPD